MLQFKLVLLDERTNNTMIRENLELSTVMDLAEGVMMGIHFVAIDSKIVLGIVPMGYAVIKEGT